MTKKTDSKKNIPWICDAGGGCDHSAGGKTLVGFGVCAGQTLVLPKVCEITLRSGTASSACFMYGCTLENKKP